MAQAWPQLGALWERWMRLQDPPADPGNQSLGVESGPGESAAAPGGGGEGGGKGSGGRGECIWGFLLGPLPM